MARVNDDDLIPQAAPQDPADNYQNPLKTALPDLWQNVKGIPIGIGTMGAMVGKDIGRGTMALIKGGAAPESETEKMIKAIPKVYADKYWGPQPEVTGNFALDVYNALMPKRAAKEFTQHPVSTLMDISTVAGAGAGVMSLAGKGANVVGAVTAAQKAAQAGRFLNQIEKFTNPMGLLTQGVVGGARKIVGKTIIDPEKMAAISSQPSMQEKGSVPAGEIGNIIKTTDNKSLLLKDMANNLDNLRKVASGDAPITKIADGTSGYLAKAQTAMDALEKEYYLDAYKELKVAGGTVSTKGGFPKMKSALKLKMQLPSTIAKIDDFLALEDAKGPALKNKMAIKQLTELKNDFSSGLTYEQAMARQNALGKIDWTSPDAVELTGYKRQIWGTMKGERVDQLDKLAPGFKTKLQAADAVYKAHYNETVGDIVDSYQKLIKEKDFKGAMAHIVDPTMSTEMAQMVKDRMGGKVDMAKAYIINDIAEKATVDGVLNYNKLRNSLNRWSGISDVYFDKGELSKLKELETTAKVLKGYENLPNGKMIIRKNLINMVGANKFIDSPLGNSFLEQAVHAGKYVLPITSPKRKEFKKTPAGFMDVSDE